jgi:hypothetical protein
MATEKIALETGTAVSILLQSGRIEWQGSIYQPVVM